MAEAWESIKGYAGWSPEAARADFAATGGVGKEGATPAWSGGSQNVWSGGGGGSSGGGGVSGGGQYGYVVKAGDTLSKIGQMMGVSWKQIYESNRGLIKNPNLIYPGQTLNVPNSSPTVSRYSNWDNQTSSQSTGGNILSKFAKTAYAAESNSPFIQKYYKQAEEVAKKYNLPVEAILSQAALESGFGKNAPGYNFFGIKGSGPAGTQYLNTTEHINGRDVKVKANFRRYNNAQESFEDYARLITQNPTYKNAVKVANDPIKYVQAVANSGYATDPNYASKVINIIKNNFSDKSKYQNWLAQANPEEQPKKVEKIEEEKAPEPIIAPAPTPYENYLKGGI